MENCCAALATNSWPGKVFAELGAQGRSCSARCGAFSALLQPFSASAGPRLGRFREGGRDCDEFLRASSLTGNSANRPYRGSDWHEWNRSARPLT